MTDESLPPILSQLTAARGGHVIEIPGQEGSYEDLPAGLHPRLIAALRRAGLDRLYSHQARATEAALEGRDVLVTTGTGSGKSLCFTIPVAQASLSEPVTRTLMIFPTKALGQDQARQLAELGLDEWLRIGVYDGDTPKSHRSAIREEADIVITNPEMIHMGMLPQHELWGKFLKNLRCVVIDEAHIYRGVFGAHLCGVVRRLLRLAAWRRARPQVIAASATLDQPDGFLPLLCGRQGVVISEDGSQRSPKFLISIPPPLPEDPDAPRPNEEAASLLCEAVSNGEQALAFCRSRISAELVALAAKRKSEHPENIAVYRAGFTPKERRRLEQGIASGQFRGIASTNALELGVDIGTLDTVIISGYPGSPSSFRQQAGRAGRRSRPGTVIFLAHEDPLEHYLAHHPIESLWTAAEPSLLKPDQPAILRQHLKCAAFERPLSPEELSAWHPAAQAAANELENQGELVWAAGRYLYPSHVSPAPAISLRGISSERWKLVCGGAVIGETDLLRAKSDLHLGAITLHQGESLIVVEWRESDREIVLAQAEADSLTQSTSQSIIEPVSILEEASLDFGQVQLMAARVTTLVTGYRRLTFDRSQVLEEHSLTLPPDTLETVAVRITPGPGLLQPDVPEDLAGWHGVEHALMALAPLFAGCDRRDLGSAWYSLCADTLEPGIFIFDRCQGGIGLSEVLFRSAGSWLRRSLQALEDCGCQDGCPLCLLSPRCESRNELLSKSGAIRLLGILAGQGA